jgi:hypothetical protein
MQNLPTAAGQLNPGPMPALQLTQLQFEIVSWQRLLDFMADENIYLKNRLSDILTDKFDKNLLEEVDGFQNRFISQDEMTWLMKHDISEIQKMLLNYLDENQKKNKKIAFKINTLRKNMVIAEKNFSILKAEFNHFLLENIL